MVMSQVVGHAKSWDIGGPVLGVTALPTTNLSQIFIAPVTRIRCLQIVPQHVPIYLQQFPSYSNRRCKKSPFSRTAAHIFVCPGDAPATITQYVAWMERQFNACQTPRIMYLSIYNSFRVIRCLSQCVSPKIAIFTTFLFPLGTPLGQSR